MPISFQCTTCKKPYKVSDKLAGKKIRCKQCNGVTRVPGQKVKAVTAPQPVATPVPTATPAPSPADDFVPIQTEWIVECDDCGRKHKPDEKLMGKRIRCKCGSVLHLTENPSAGIPLAPLDPDLVDLSQMQAYTPQAGPAPVYQAPPPSFQKSSSSSLTIREQRRREAEEMVRAADQKQEWRKTLKDEDDEEEWGPLGKILGGAGMIAGGAVWTFLAWQAGYIYPYSFVLMGLGVISIIMGLIESI